MIYLSLIFAFLPMYSVTGSHKYYNHDTQDKDFNFPSQMTYEELISLCDTQYSQGTISRLIERRFSTIQYDTNNLEGNSIRLLHWNLLSQALGQYTDNFDRCPSKALEWKRRRCHMLEEILRYDPDIISLQEVDHFDFLSRALATQSYNGEFKPKPDSPCLYVMDNNGPDGCAIFYKKNKFELVEKHEKILEVDSELSNQVSILLVLKDKKTQKELCVSTTHLKARQGDTLPNFRNEEGKDLLRFISSHAAGRSVIVSGDFNAEPNEPVYETMSSSSDLPLDSVYKLLSGSEPEFTSWKIRKDEGEVKQTLDYMFYTKNKLTVSKILNMPNESEIGVNRVPSLSYPSDHFALVIDFYFQKTSEPIGSKL